MSPTAVTIEAGNSLWPVPMSIWVAVVPSYFHNSLPVPSYAMKQSVPFTFVKPLGIELAVPEFTLTSLACRAIVLPRSQLRAVVATEIERLVRHGQVRGAGTACAGVDVDLGGGGAIVVLQFRIGPIVRAEVERPLCVRQIPREMNSWSLG